MSKTKWTLPTAVYFVWAFGLAVTAATGSGALFCVWFLGGLAVLNVMDA